MVCLEPFQLPTIRMQATSDQTAQQLSRQGFVNELTPWNHLAIPNLQRWANIKLGKFGWFEDTICVGGGIIFFFGLKPDNLKSGRKYAKAVEKVVKIDRVASRSGRAFQKGASFDNSHRWHCLWHFSHQSAFSELYQNENWLAQPLKCCQHVRIILLPNCPGKALNLRLKWSAHDLPFGLRMLFRLRLPQILRFRRVGRGDFRRLKCLARTPNRVVARTETMTT